jgi:hypothetical protein
MLTANADTHTPGKFLGIKTASTGSAELMHYSMVNELSQ